LPKSPARSGFNLQGPKDRGGWQSDEHRHQKTAAKKFHSHIK
jgi:hypothetical protein